MDSIPTHHHTRTVFIAGFFPHCAVSLVARRGSILTTNKMLASAFTGRLSFIHPELLRHSTVSLIAVVGEDSDDEDTDLRGGSDVR